MLKYFQRINVFLIIFLIFHKIKQKMDKVDEAIERIKNGATEVE